MIYFIAGAGGSGKSAIIDDLKFTLHNAIIHDFDDIGVPENADKKWRQEATDQWLKLYLNEKDSFDYFVICGQVVLGEVLACHSSRQIDKINFCLLDVSDFERIHRLKKRNIYGTDQNMLNWSSWLRMHHQDPQWMQHVIKEDCWQDLDFSAWDQLEHWGNDVNFKIIDTTTLEIPQVAENVAYWINQSNEDPVLLNLNNGLYQLQFSTNAAYEYILGESLSFDEKVLPFTQKPKRIEINFVVKHQGGVVGGIYADLYHWNILYVCILFVSEAHRNKNLGSVLLNQVEEKAKSMGSTLCHVETYDFQAKDFYIKQGYEVFGILDDCPPGHKRYFLKKNLVKIK